MKVSSMLYNMVLVTLILERKENATTVEKKEILNKIDVHSRVIKEKVH